jgi:hypothetical protein
MPLANDIKETAAPEKATSFFELIARHLPSRLDDVRKTYFGAFFPEDPFGGILRKISLRDM